MPHVGWQEMLILLVVVLLIFGTKRLPEVGRSLGGAIKEFKAGSLEKEQDKKPAETMEPVVESSPQEVI